jgi:hypothetical protein
MLRVVYEVNSHTHNNVEMNCKFFFLNNNIINQINGS